MKKLTEKQLSEAERPLFKEIMILARVAGRKHTAEFLRWCADEYSTKTELKRIYGKQ